MWDGDGYLLSLHPSFPTVPSPPCGMETAFSGIPPTEKSNCSEPTVWDGDTRKRDEINHGFTVPSPPCGMETEGVKFFCS